LNKKLFFIFLFFIFLLFGCANTRLTLKIDNTNSELVSAEGTAPIINGDITGAKKTSLHESLKNALSLVVGVYVSQESLVSKSVLIEDNITSQTEGYIEKYNIIKEWREGDFYKTQIKAVVRKEDLSAKIKALELEPKKLGNPVVKFNIEELIDGKISNNNYSANELKKQFIEDGFIVSDSDISDILITGNVSSDLNPDNELGGMVSYRSTLAIKAIKTNSKDVISTSENTVSGIDVTKQAAAKTSIIKNVQKVSKKLSQSTLTYLKEHSTIQLNISNIYDLNTLNSLVMAMRSLIDVRDCKVRNFANNIASIDIDLKRGNPLDLAKKIEQLTSIKVKINKVEAYYMEGEILK
jgi:hypothetical protein